MSTPTGLFLLSEDAYAAVYEPHAAKEIAGSVNIIAPPHTAHTIHENLDLLQSIDFIFSGWGMPKVTSEFLTAAPNLKVIFYGAGSVNAWATPAMWQRGIAVTTANQANAVPAAEFTLATILFSLKHGFRLAKDQPGSSGLLPQRGRPDRYGNGGPTGRLATATVRGVCRRVRPVPNRFRCTPIGCKQSVAGRAVQRL
jgi:phosphoglycerate dehydrogenase-like enzyme